MNLNPPFGLCACGRPAIVSLQGVEYCAPCFDAALRAERERLRRLAEPNGRDVAAGRPKKTA